MIMRRGGKETAVGYSGILWTSLHQLHQRGIQALLLAGCLLGFGLGQTIGVTYGPHAPHINRVSIERSAEAVVATSRAGGSLGNIIAPHQAASTSVHTAPAKAQPQLVSLATPQPQATSTPGDAHQHGKGHHKGQDGKHGKQGNGNGNGNDGNGNNGNGNNGNGPKTKDHNQGNQGSVNIQLDPSNGNQAGQTSGN